MMSIEQIARVCHEANRGYCESIGDFSQVEWSKAPDWQQQSAIEGVQRAMEGATLEELHASWSEAKRRDGWVYGDIKDAENKTHPCLVPYDELPIEQRRKDALFLAVVNALM